MKNTLISHQRGSMILEALISILIFSMGILAIVGLQANSIKMSSDAKYRTDASLLADRLVGMMWTDLSAAVAVPSVGCSNPFNTVMPNGLADYQTGGAQFNAWWAAASSVMPNAVATVNTATVLNPPACSVGRQQTSRTSTTITISWTQPGGSQHTYNTTTTVNAQKDN
ncbi:MAG: hypothetical protein HOO97_04820 [Sideroxydans sp.]|nr:hypothetical protein [Sideroxydans sp.]